MHDSQLFRGILCPAVLFCTVHAAEAAVGVTTGAFDVTPDGAATYTVPITVPPGTAGMEPQLALRYSSQSGNGLLGVGWSLTGLSQISRCPATVEPDGFYEAVNFSNNDRLCLDGERLVVVSGSYGQQNAEYRTEIEQFKKIVQRGGDLNAANTWFEVRTKDGLIQEYGRNNGAAFTVPGKSYSLLWSVNRILDTAGNYIDFQYGFDSANNERYVDRIDYAGNINTGHPPNVAVVFDYEDLAQISKARPDIYERYMIGGSDKIRTNNRLRGIKTYDINNLTREYRLSYTISDFSGQSLLTGLEECGTSPGGTTECLPPTEFDWTDPEPGFTQFSALNPPFDLYTSDGRQRGEAIDINGNGRTDLVQAYGSTLNTRLNTQNGASQFWQTSTAYRLPGPLFTNDGERVAVLIDVTGDGLPDYVQGNGANRQTWINTGSGWQVDNRYKLPVELYGTVGNSDISPFGAMEDLDGDSLADLLISYATDTGSPEWEVWLNQGADCSGTSCAWQLTSWALQPFQPPTVQGVGPTCVNCSDLGLLAMFRFVTDSQGEVRSMAQAWLHDLVGDGLPDYVVAHGDSDGNYLWSFLNASGGGWVESPAYALPAPLVKNSGLLRLPVAQLVDITGSGLPSLVCSAKAYIGPASFFAGICGSDEVNSGNWSRATYINTGDGWEYDSTYNLPTPLGGHWNPFSGSGTSHFLEGMFLDLNGDGKPEFIYSSGRNPPVPRRSFVNHPGGICNGEGCKWEEDADWIVPFDINSNHSVRGVIGQADRDGRPDLIEARGTRRMYISNGSGPNSQPADLLEAVRPPASLAAPVDISYTTILDERYYAPVQPGLPPVSYPERRVADPYVVVAETDAGKGMTEYGYRDLRVHQLGRGLLGFGAFGWHNTSTGIMQETAYSQAFPNTGMPLQDLRRTQSKFLNRVNYTLSSSTLGSGQSVRYFPNVEITEEAFFDLVDNTSPLTTTRTTTTYDNFGNPTEIVQQDFPGTLPGAGTYTSTTTNQYSNDTSQWLLGRLIHTSVTRSGPHGLPVTRESAFEYDPVTGLLTAEIVEPNDPGLWLRTVYEYDAFGNQTEVTVTGAGVDAQTTTASWNARGRFKVSTANALGHTESYTWFGRHGGMHTRTGPNNLTTTWGYDAFGRQIRRTNPDGTIVRTDYLQCDVILCPSEYLGKLAIRARHPDGLHEIQVHDEHGRTVLESSFGYDGQWVDVETEYDERDRVVARTAPHFRGETQHWTTFEYDTHDRLTESEAPLSETISFGLVNQFSHNGLVTIHTDPLGNMTHRHQDALGQTVKVVDAMGGTTEFEHDPYGNVLLTRDANNSVTTVSYDKQGRKIALSDPNMGNWSYGYNALGELISQTDAKNQTVIMEYDKLGRIVSRTEAEGISTWLYDTRWAGQLTEETAPPADASMPDFAREFFYDALGRVEETRTRIGSDNYPVFQTYDTQSRPEVLVYPSGLSVRNEYNAFGYLEQVVNDATSHVYWTLGEMDAFGNVTAEFLGNGLETKREYDAARGHVNFISTGTGSSFEVQYQSYAWDAAGNLSGRGESRAWEQDPGEQMTLADFYSYDQLHRLTSMDSLAAYAAGGTDTYSADLAYDAAGNITSKTDVGDYTYGQGSAGPNAVTQITGPRAASYQYDANGNLESDSNGRQFLWTSYNKPWRLQRGAGSAAMLSGFSYGPDRRRYYHWRQRVQGAGEIHYVGELYDFNQRYGSNIAQERHYIRAGGRVVAIEMVNHPSGGGVRYLHHDYLGSVDVMTDAGGGIVRRTSYDPFGKRRHVNWMPDGNDSLLEAVQPTDYGFTGHEHLDHVELIHMKGRVYNPTLGRFISPDPVIQTPENTQNYNRYSYVINNPLRYTDPDGHIIGVLAPFFVGLALPVLTGNDPQQAFAVAIAFLPGGQTLGSALFKGFAAGMVASEGDLKGGLIGAASAGAFHGVGRIPHIGTANFSTPVALAGKAVLHGAVGGASSAALGGKFKHGFLSASTTAGLSPGIEALFGTEPGLAPVRIVAAAVVGGTATDLGGGKFANGAITGAFSRAFNTEPSLRRAQREAELERLARISGRDPTTAQVRQVGRTLTAGAAVVAATPVTLAGPGGAGQVAARGLPLLRGAIDRVLFNAFGGATRFLNSSFTVTESILIRGASESIRLGVNPAVTVPLAADFVSGFTPSPATTPASAAGLSTSIFTGISLEDLLR